MKFISIAIWTYLLFVLQTGLARDLTIAGCVPNLILAGLFVILIRIGGQSGLLMAGGWGLLSDMLTDGRLGPDVVCFAVAASLVQHVHARWNLSSPWKLGILSSVLAGAVIVGSASLRMLADGISPDWPALGIYAVGSALYAGILVAAVSLAVRLVLGQSAEVAAAESRTVSNQWRMLTG